MRGARVDPDDHELEALDPRTGQPIAPPSPVDEGTGSVVGHRRRLRRIRTALVVLAIASAGGAAYFAITIRTLRTVEETWRQAMAVDEARADADRRVLTVLESYDDLESADRFLIAVGSETSGRLATAERRLDDLRIADPRLSALRDQMIEALRFRQLQMGAGRRRLGDTPLVEVEATLARQLGRWDLAPTEPARPRLAAADDTFARLARFADDPTGAVVVGVRRGALVVIDVDAGEVTTRPLSSPVDRLVTAGPRTILVTGKDGITAYHLAGKGVEPAWTRRGVSAFATADGTGAWVHEGPHIARVQPDGTVAEGPYTTPAGAVPVAATGDGIVLSTSTRGGATVELWHPARGDRQPLAGAVHRLIGAGPGLVVVEATATAAERQPETDDDDRVVRVIDAAATVLGVLHFPTEVGAVAQRPGQQELVMSVGPLAGRVASVFRFTATGTVTALQHPRVSIQPGALAWSPDGAVVFWLTPDGRIALHRLASRQSQPLRAPVEGLEQIVVVAPPQ